MVLIRSLLLIAATILSVKFIPYLLPKHKLPLHLDGKTDKKFSKVSQAFRENFEFGWEHEGAAFSVYHHVADLWGGYADQSALRKWTEDTMTTVFSVTKAVASLCIAMLVDKGKLNYKSLVTEYWPKFGQNGKENITVEMLVNHEAGLAHVVGDINFEAANDHTKMAEIFEKQRPLWTPGTFSGYHCLTHGWLLDQIVRRVDDKHRSIGQFFRDELAQIYDLDFHIGLPLELNHRVAHMSFEGLPGIIGQMLDDPVYIKMYLIMLKESFKSNSPINEALDDVKDWFNFVKYNSLNDPEIRKMEIASAGGIGTARSMAKLFSLAIDGTLLSQKTLRKISSPTVIDQWDPAFLDVVSRAFGFMYYRSPKGGWEFGHRGYGGNFLRVDPKEKLVIVYVSNGLKPGLGNSARTWRNLYRAAYESI